eukprot:176127_1
MSITQDNHIPPTGYICHKCGISGHWIQECTSNTQTLYPPYGYICHRCGIPGHWIKNCPSNNYHLNYQHYNHNINPNYSINTSIPAYQQLNQPTINDNMQLSSTNLVSQVKPLRVPSVSPPHQITSVPVIQPQSCQPYLIMIPLTVETLYAET